MEWHLRVGMGMENQFQMVQPVDIVHFIDFNDSFLLGPVYLNENRDFEEKTKHIFTFNKVLTRPLLLFITHVLTPYSAFCC